ncbi:hypothetical protein F3I16_16175 [Pseudomonas sp. L-22-4S-12]|uniref:hypothetical protein n=1 Tax=Pseudomonas sp. L-22-4S-12 TaxID=2610893 RepID=UPI001328044A|nr:hypothetical protein [Pseudomonas sp. L-22-4S-12]MWV17580.1 hypothetical protein [Pseudomonas sp. L-22-4S-12]
MRDLRFSRTFSLLQQEGHLARTSLLSGIDLLLKANLDEKNIGKFYAAFFQLTIGMERILKLVITTNYLLENSYTPPSDKLLRKYGHHIKEAYIRALDIHNKWAVEKLSPPLSGSIDDLILDFLQEFAGHARYYNLSELSNSTPDPGPLGKWYSICCEAADLDIGITRLNKCAEQTMYQMDQLGIAGYSPTLDFDGHPMTWFDYAWRLHKIKMIAPHMVWRLIQFIEPLYDTLRSITYEAGSYEERNNISLQVIPHMYEFFVFALASKSDTLRRKSWVRTFLD